MWFLCRYSRFLLFLVFIIIFVSKCHSLTDFSRQTARSHDLDFGSQPLPSRTGHTTNSSACTGQRLNLPNPGKWCLQKKSTIYPLIRFRHWYFVFWHALRFYQSVGSTMYFFIWSYNHAFPPFNGLFMSVRHTLCCIMGTWSPPTPGLHVHPMSWNAGLLLMEISLVLGS